ncbi:MAG: CBS domain-containing protein, partial [Selenomonadaceae bacterium]|nr:CBS domain-containing protein [Selenomonadaceae bacterium]
MDFIKKNIGLLLFLILCLGGIIYLLIQIMGQSKLKQEQVTAEQQHVEFFERLAKENLKLIRENPLTVFAVGRDSLDDFCGVLYAKDLLNASLERKSLDLMQYLRKPMFIPRSMETFRLLEKFRDSGIHEAVVLDEYGGVIGFITLDDILQEIIGDSATNIEPDLIQVTQRDENSWYVDGLYSIDDFKERFGVDELPDEEHDHYQTMGGFLTSYFGYIPKVAECCEWNGFRFEIVYMDRARIDKILITKLENQEEDLTAENA